MSENPYSQYDWALSLLAQRIAADVIIQEGAVTLKNNKVLKEGLKRCQLHTRLLQLILQFRKIHLPERRSADIIELLQSASSSSADIVPVMIERSKPMLNVLANPDRLEMCLRVVIILLLLEDPSLKRVLISLRCRTGYVSVKIQGGKVRNQQLLDKELIAVISSSLGQDRASIDWTDNNQHRIVYIRIYLSSQMNLI